MFLFRKLWKLFFNWCLRVIKHIFLNDIHFLFVIHAFIKLPNKALFLYFKIILLFPCILFHRRLNQNWWRFHLLERASLLMYNSFIAIKHSIYFWRMLYLDHVNNAPFNLFFIANLLLRWLLPQIYCWTMLYLRLEELVRLMRMHSPAMKVVPGLFRVGISSHNAGWFTPNTFCLIINLTWGTVVIQQPSCIALINPWVIPLV